MRQPAIEGFPLPKQRARRQFACGPGVQIRKCVCGSSPVMRRPWSHPDAPVTPTFRAECPGCGRSGEQAMRIEDALRSWNANV